MNMRKYIYLLLLMAGLAVSQSGVAQTTPTSVFGTVDLSKYNDNMTVTCLVKQGSVAVADCELAAYDANGELRGKAFSHAEYGGMIFLTIQGGTKGETLHFKATTDHSTILDVNETLTFTANQVLGTYADPQVFTLSSTVTGDVDASGTVTIRDIAILVNMLLNSSTTEAADVDKSGAVNITDVTAIRNIILRK